MIRYRKVNGILNALAMQIEDGGDNSAVVARLFDALEAAVGALEGGRAIAFASGMAAASAIVYALAPKVNPLSIDTSRAVAYEMLSGLWRGGRLSVRQRKACSNLADFKFAM